MWHTETLSVIVILNFVHAVANYCVLVQLQCCAFSSWQPNAKQTWRTPFQSCNTSYLRPALAYSQTSSREKRWRNICHSSFLWQFLSILLFDEYSWYLDLVSIYMHVGVDASRIPECPRCSAAQREGCLPTKCTWSVPDRASAWECFCRLYRGGNSCFVVLTSVSTGTYVCKSLCAHSLHLAFHILLSLYIRMSLVSMQWAKLNRTPGRGESLTACLYGVTTTNLVMAHNRPVRP